MKYIYFLILPLILICCSSSNPTAYPTDFSAKYYMKNALMKTELTIEVNGEKLKISYDNGQRNIKKNSDYTVTEKEAGEIYKYMKSSGVSTMQHVESERKPDAPVQTLSGTYDNKTNSVTFGSAPNDVIAKLKDMLLALADKYDKTWRSDTDMQ